MARPEITGKRIGTTPVKPKRRAGPPIAEPDAVEPNDDPEEAPATVSSAYRARAPPLPPGAYSVEQFCRAHDISIGHFYALLKAGIGPRLMKVGIRTLISVEEAARWRAERTAASSESR